MDELRAAAGRAFAEIVLLEQRDAIAAGRGVDGDANARRAAADHDDVPRPVVAGQSLELAFAIEITRVFPCRRGQSFAAQCFERSTASLQRARNVGGLVGRHLRLEAAIDLPVARDFVAVLPDADRQAGQVGRAERRGFGHLRADDRQAAESRPAIGATCR